MFGEDLGAGVFFGFADVEPVAGYGEADDAAPFGGKPGNEVGGIIEHIIGDTVYKLALKHVYAGVGIEVVCGLLDDAADIAAVEVENAERHRDIVGNSGG